MKYCGLNIIAVDDERLALRTLEGVIGDALPECAINGFTTPGQALEYAADNRVDVAFLDIEMPGMNGISLSKRLKELYGKTNIVFVTGYSEYALDSYEVKASGYLMKPIEKEHVLSAMDWLRNPPERKPRSRVFVQTFGNFELFLDGKPVTFSRRTKAKEALAYLIDMQGTSVTTAEIASAIWDDREYNRSLQNQTQKIISYMMKVLRENGIGDIIIKEWNAMSVDREKISCDYYDLLDGDLAAINAFGGKYMNGYPWAEMTTVALCKKTRIV